MYILTIVSIKLSFSLFYFLIETFCRFEAEVSFI